MTVPEIQRDLSRRGKRVSRATLFQYFRRFKIRPLGVRSCPRIYPDNAADTIAAKLGMNGNRSRV